MKLYRSVFVASLCLAFGSALGACGGGDSGSTTGAGTTGGDTADHEDHAAEGATLVKDNGCGGCHGPDLSGGTTVAAPNITWDKDTGIGNWTDAQVKAAITMGVDDEGEALCSGMPKFDKLSDHDIEDIIAYLRSVSVNKASPEDTCK